MRTEIEKGNPEIRAETLNPPRPFHMAAENPDGTLTIITCGKAMTINKKLHEFQDVRQ